jgi:hypothetical protein
MAQGGGDRAVTPEVREGLGRTKSGRVVASLGDTSIAYDPLPGKVRKAARSRLQSTSTGTLPIAVRSTNIGFGRRTKGSTRNEARVGSW